MNRLEREHLKRIVVYKPGRPIEEIRRRFGIKDVIKLASNENALPPSRRVISCIAKNAYSLNRYPDSNCFYLKRALSKYLRLSSDNLIIGNGSDEIITFAIRTFLNRDEEIIIAKPTFLIYDIVAKIENIKVKYVPLKDFRYDVDGIAKAVTKRTKLIFIANPDNPTGTYITGSEVDKLIYGLRKDIIVFFDEAYYEFAKASPGYPKTIKFLKEGRSVIITRSFSKAYSLAGLRIGYGIANKELISGMNKVREPFNVNSLAQLAAIEALKDKSFVTKTLRVVKEGKEFIYKQMEKMDIFYIPSVTNFILFKIDNTPLVYNKLLQRGVIVRDMDPWGLRGFLRVTIGTMRENRKFISALKEILTK